MRSSGQLATRAKLKVLCLGRDDGSGIWRDNLEMSLASGLDKLAGLKELWRLGVDSLDHKIGVPELE